MFSTADDNQSAVTIRVFQGEREMAADNKILGSFNLENIPPAPRGMPQIEVTFDIDANGIVSVSAKDRATNKEQKITIQASGGLSDDEIDKMVRDAEAHAEDDKHRRDGVEARNQADALLHSTEKSLAEYGDKVGDEEREAIETAASELRESLNGENLEDIKAKSQALATASMKLGEAMYKAQADNAEAGEEQPGEDDSVVDADFEELDGQDRRS